MTGVRGLVESGSLRSVFQPIVDLESGAVVAYEALVRGPAGPYEWPDVLFAGARAEGCLAALDEACRRAAFAGAVELGIHAPLTLFVNVEPEVLDTAPIEDLLALAHRAPVRLRVVLEITERALASRPAELLRTVERIRSAGWSVALDDVGADPMSLAFMPLLRPEVVKLDLALVQASFGPDKAAVMTAVTAYAESSGALILAEGIETPEQAQLARALGARLGQGWLFGRPGASRTGSESPTPLPLVPPSHKPPADSPFDALPASTALRQAPKRLLLEISHQLERKALGQGRSCVVASTFQHVRHFTPATAVRYAALAAEVGFVCALGAGLSPWPAPGVRGGSPAPGSGVLDEWDVIVLGPHFAVALLARDLGDDGPDGDRRFAYALTYRRETVVAAAASLVRVVAARTAADLAATVG